MNLNGLVVYMECHIPFGSSISSVSEDCFAPIKLIAYMPQTATFPQLIPLSPAPTIRVKPVHEDCRDSAAGPAADLDLAPRISRVDRGQDPQSKTRRPRLHGKLHVIPVPVHRVIE